MRRLTVFLCLFVAGTTFAQTHSTDTDPFVSVNVLVFVLSHVRVVDGTGTMAKEDQAVVIANGKIRSIGPAASLQPPAAAQVLERTGYTVIPGLVGMHNHLYYTASFSMQVGPGSEVAEPGLIIANIPFSAPRLYLGAGVTTMRTTGERRTVYRFEGQAAHRRESNARPEHRCHRPIP